MSGFAIVGRNPAPNKAGGVGLGSAFLSLAPDTGGDREPVFAAFAQGNHCARPVDYRLLCRQRESRPCAHTDWLRICQPFRVDLFSTLLLLVRSVALPLPLNTSAPYEPTPKGFPHVS